MKMEKTPRYTQRERNMVLGFAAQYKDVIENKRTDAESNRKKDEVWRQIAKEFNCRVYHQRSSKQLRQLYKNMKLLLKKDLCSAGAGGGGGSSGGGGNGGGNGGGGAGGGDSNGGDPKGNRSFMDILNALSQQDSVTQYITEQMSSPNGYCSGGRQQKCDDDYDDSKLPSVTYDGLDNDVIVIKSEDISDNEQSSPNDPVADDVDEDDEDCLSTKDIPEVCLEEEDDEIFATDLRQSGALPHGKQPPSLQLSAVLQHQQQQQHHHHHHQQQQQQHQHHHQQHQQQHQQQQQPNQQQPPPPPTSEMAIPNVGGIRVGSIGSIANLTNATKSLHPLGNGSGNAALNAAAAVHSNPTLNISLATTNSRTALTVEQQLRDQQQQLLFHGLGLSAVHPEASQPTALPTALQPSNERTLAINSSQSRQNGPQTMNGGSQKFGCSTGGNGGGSSNCGGTSSRNNEYLLSLAIEERKRKIDLLNAQIEYWKTLTKKLDTNSGGYNPMPSCLCHFPAKVNGLQSQPSSS